MPKPLGGGYGVVAAAVLGRLLLLLIVCCWVVEAFAPGRPAFSRSTRAARIRPSGTVWAFGSSYLDSLGPPSNDSDNDNNNNKDRAGSSTGGSNNMDGIASFQSGSYLDNLQRNNPTNYSGESAYSAEPPPFQQYGRSAGPTNAPVSASSYLNALGGNASPWQQQQQQQQRTSSSNRIAPWKQREGPKFLPVPQQPPPSSPPPPPTVVEPAELSSPTDDEDARVENDATATPIMDEQQPTAAAEIVDEEDTFSDVAASTEQPMSNIVDETDELSSTNNDVDDTEVDDLDEEERAALLLDMLDSTREVYENLAGAYENLVGDMIEGEGIIIQAPVSASGTVEKAGYSDIVETITEIEEEEDVMIMSVDTDDSTADTYDDESLDEYFDDDDANEPIYLDSLDENDNDDGPVPTLENENDDSNKDVQARKQPPPTPFFGNLVNEMWDALVPAPIIQRAKPPAPQTAPATANIETNVEAASSAEERVSPSPPPPSKLADAISVTGSNAITSDNNADELRDEDLPVSVDFAAEFEDNEEVDVEMEALDTIFMGLAIDLASSAECVRSSYPNPRVGAVWVAEDGSILGQGFSSYRGDAIRTALETAGLELATLDGEWIDTWPASSDLRKQIATSTLYVTLEPSMSARGLASPPITRLIEQIGIPRVVIGSADPVTERTLKGAASLNAAGISVSLGRVMREECDELIEEYSLIANSRLRRMARTHFERFGRPLGFLHCSVVDSDNVEAFARQGNAFGSSFGGKQLSYRDFGSYELAPPPDVVWADGGQLEYDNDDDGDDDIMSVDFDDEDYQEILSGTPIMPYYEQVDAVVGTFPRQGNGPPDDDSVAGRLRGLRWLATHGCNLPPGVERVLVLDATDLKDLPLNNGDPNLPSGFDIEAFWRGANRKQTRIILRRSGNESAHAAARAAAKAAAAAAEAAARASAAIDSGDAAECAQAALECQKVAQDSMEFVKKELMVSTELRRKFEAKGVKVESIEGGEPIDIMKHLGKRSGHRSVVWRAGCWGERGVRAILEGAFQMVSAHLAVPAIGGRFWQLMIAENAVQAACGPQSKVKIFADQEDISMEYCDNLDVDEDCILTIDGKPVRHVRLDCRVALVDKNRPRQFDVTKTEKMNRKILTEEAPWFL